MSVPLSYMQNAIWYYDAYFAAEKARLSLYEENKRMEKERSIGLFILTSFGLVLIFEAVEIGIHWK